MASDVANDHFMLDVHGYESHEHVMWHSVKKLVYYDIKGLLSGEAAINVKKSHDAPSWLKVWDVNVAWRCGD